MGDLLLMYRACGAETREDYLPEVANENGDGDPHERTEGSDVIARMRERRES